MVEEVRTLAHRFRAAAHDIGKLIGDSSARVAQGVRLAEAAGATLGVALGGIRGAVRKVVDAVRSISGGTAEIAGAVTQIQAAVRDLDATTQRNAAAAERSAAAADRVGTPMAALTGVAGGFRLNDARERPGTRAA